jgi:hypothetical protein
MNQITNRRLCRVEKQAEPIIAERQRKEAADAARLRKAARDHATKVVTLILHGDPRIDEPLAVAWRRALANLGFTDIPPAEIPIRLRARVLADLPCETENTKFTHVLSTAPQWLLAFCMCVIDAHYLGIGLPHEPGPTPEPGMDGVRDSLDSWPDLPTGMLEAGGPIPELDLSPLDALPNPFDGLSPEEAIDLCRLLENGKENWSRRNRNRHREIIAKIDTSNLG